MQRSVSDPPECLSDLTPRVQKSDYQPTKIIHIQQMVIVRFFYLHLFLKNNNISPRSRFSLITVIMLGRDFRLIYLLTMKTLDWRRGYNVTGAVWCSCIIGHWGWLCVYVLVGAIGVSTFLHLMILSVGQCPDISPRQIYTSNIMVCWGCGSAGSYIW